jgi:uncharacterized protein YbjT (DUF2867 family)
MFSITGITGNVGGYVAHHLLAAGLPVRAVVRDGRKGAAWAERGCEVAIADITDAPALASAFKGAEGVFVLVPPNFDPALGFPEAQEIAATLKYALEKGRPGTVVYLSTIGVAPGQPKGDDARNSRRRVRHFERCSGARCGQLHFELLSCRRGGRAGLAWLRARTGDSGCRS